MCEGTLRPVERKIYAQYYTVYRIMHEMIWKFYDIGNVLDLYEKFDNGHFLYIDGTICGGAIIEKNWCGLPFMRPPFENEAHFLEAVLKKTLEKSELKKPLTAYGFNRPMMQMLTRIGFAIENIEQNMIAKTGPYHTRFDENLIAIPPQNEDFEELIELYTTTYTGSPLRYIRNKDRRYYRKLLEEQLNSAMGDLSRVIRDRKSGHLIAACMVSFWQDLPTLEDIVVTPAYQKKGIGTQLLRHVLGSNHEKYLAVRLNVVPGNKAKQLYRRFGFIEGPSVYTMVIKGERLLTLPEKVKTLTNSGKQRA